ncbi:hypothetical protein [Kineosporia sp. NBRC 101731]|uniref:hypothetical protein n=1 Tax=Kineosporia sp. NBRC 101731 TaxID=3032199 RepID=UPI0024A215F4|nr:hypothetical protein [Kineosporia sp. NBRC 101731]GLY32038.1 hypothetical protein Kisp02_54030 [Kineosporia sp. NBRC 101731]
MTRPLDQADVDAVLEQRYGVDILDAATTMESFAARFEALSWLNAAVAIGWTPPARDEEATDAR